MNYLKKAFSLSLLFFSSLYFFPHYASTIIYGPTKPTTSLTRLNTAVIFDVDDVILKRDEIKPTFLATAALINADPAQKQALEKMNNWFTLNYTAFNKATDISEENAFDLVAEHNPIVNELVALKTAPHEFKPLRYFLMQSYVQAARWFDTVDTIKKLQSAGYPIALGTNVHSTTTLPLFSLEASPCKPEQFLHIHTSESTPLNEGKLVKKPAPAYTLSMLESCYTKAKHADKNHPYVFIFIDDKRSNVETAVKHGQSDTYITIGIHYTSTTQLEADLKEVGLIF